MGHFGNNFETRKRLIAEYRRTGDKPFEYVRPILSEGDEHMYPKEAAIESSAFLLYQSFLGGGGCIGGCGSGAARVNSRWQVIGELSE